MNTKDLLNQINQSYKSNSKSYTEVVCSACGTKRKIYKYSKCTINCELCTTLISKPGPNKIKLYALKSDEPTVAP